MRQTKVWEHNRKRQQWLFINNAKSTLVTMAKSCGILWTKQNVNWEKRIERAMTFYGVIRKLMFCLTPGAQASFYFSIQGDLSF